MLTQLRVLGYVFNPVSFYWCYAADGSLACMVAELNNTFGERLPELLHGPALEYEHDKRLHVSPFFGLDQLLRVRVLASRATRSGRASTCATTRRPAAARRSCTAGGRELTNASLARLLRPLPADAGPGDRRSSTGRRCGSG